MRIQIYYNIIFFTTIFIVYLNLLSKISKYEYGLLIKHL